MKKLFVSFLTLTLMLVFVSFGFAAGLKPSDYVNLHVTGKDVNVRSQASTKGSPIGKISSDNNGFLIAERATIKDSTGMEWYRIVLIGDDDPENEKADYDGNYATYSKISWTFEGATEGYIAAKFVRAADLTEWDSYLLSNYGLPKESAVIVNGVPPELSYKVQYE